MILFYMYWCFIYMPACRSVSLEGIGFPGTGVTSKVVSCHVGAGN